MSQNITLTIIQANHITTSHIHACFNIVNHFLYFVSSHDAVTIWNHQIKQIITAITHNSPNTRFTKLIITSMSCLDHVFSIQLSHIQVVGSCGIICALTIPRLPAHTNPIAPKLNKTFLNVFPIFY